MANYSKRVLAGSKIPQHTSLERINGKKLSTQAPKYGMQLKEYVFEEQ